MRLIPEDRLIGQQMGTLYRVFKSVCTVENKTYTYIYIESRLSVRNDIVCTAVVCFPTSINTWSMLPT
jgi:hypothetical protein